MARAVPDRTDQRRCHRRRPAGRNAETVRDVLLPLTYGGTETLAGLVTGRAREDAVRDARAEQPFPEAARPDEDVPEHLWDESAVLPAQRDACRRPRAAGAYDTGEARRTPNGPAVVSHSRAARPVPTGGVSRRTPGAP
ncbi:hypothetical protein ABZY42_26550 [Streptomyces sp. NPDC006622]|uniref:hypothetical protein n=1 Tax=Streptomyces sp. NPDC006622 TaxID=3155459 RepID=UPI0033A1DE58